MMLNHNHPLNATGHAAEHSLPTHLEEAWKSVPVVWDLNPFIASNPLKELEHLSFEEAMACAHHQFQNTPWPEPMEHINRQTIKWMQAFFDERQAKLSMPFREEGLYHAWKKVAIFDNQLHQNNVLKQDWLAGLSSSAEKTIAQVFERLGIDPKQQYEFSKLMLLSLPGWSSHVKYQATRLKHQHALLWDYLAVRLCMTYLLWPEARTLLSLSPLPLELSHHPKKELQQIAKNEEQYQQHLLKQLSAAPRSSNKTAAPEAQWLFCIDVRSEPFRRALESQSNCETFGCAGFFNLPICIEEPLKNHHYDACPVILSPQQKVKKMTSAAEVKQRHLLNGFKKIYSELKYNFTTPFVVAEFMGIFSGALMFVKTLSPKTLYQRDRSHYFEGETFDLSSLSLEQEAQYAEQLLKSIGLTHGFSPYLILCGHKSETKNNPYHTALDCGACGAHAGGNNARIMAQILNQPEVRHLLKDRGIDIPEHTIALAADHNTTTDEIRFYAAAHAVNDLKQPVVKAQTLNAAFRTQFLGYDGSDPVSFVKRRSMDWSQTRPEWGLARNAAFIVAPRALTQQANLEGRTFLHSYDSSLDPDGAILKSILQGPMVVAQWINAQYLFSALDPVAYGSGSKVTQNITGKRGIMQGNASDLMYGLPIQSVYDEQGHLYHEPVRLTTLIQAPRLLIENVIQSDVSLQSLVTLGWVHVMCREPDSQQFFRLQRDLHWERISVS